MDVPLITCLQPSKRFMVDDYVWSHTKLCQYTVRSGYVIATQAAQEIVEPSTTKLKSQVWKPKTSRKIKHFLWLALSGCVASNSRLADRHCGTDKTCHRCGDEEESINHILFRCPPALQVSALSNIATIPGVFPSNSIYTNFDYLLWQAKEQGTPKDQLEVFPWILWYLWKARNEKTFNNKDTSPLDTLELASSEAAAWRLAQILDSYEEPDDSQDEEVEADGEILGEFRCQIDASWESRDQFAGLGFVMLGPVRTFGLKCTQRHLSVLHAKLAALLWAMESSIHQGWTLVHFETDCLTIIKLTEEIDDWPSFSRELSSFSDLKAKFLVFSISHILRTLNVRADHLAKIVRAQGSLFYHVDSIVP
ncbi:PREDICTED: uncharacterized protein LOC104728605 [Camelina sativa]|uniref:Uncharacterized protein LOC104728605 n=1 Tax=Camelina sativa TaxID=90675 RepID=A0ABM0UT22_CAMSA|nr:PREDICTED: uncharacterized protein LOC104728605 [Camelina sativa]